MAAGNAITMQTVTDTFGQGVAQIEQLMNNQLAIIKTNPNPSQADLTLFQSYVTMWSGIVNLESSVIKQFGDTVKQVATNAGS